MLWANLLASDADEGHLHFRPEEVKYVYASFLTTGTSEPV